MADHTEWTIERRPSGWFGRLVNPAGGGSAPGAALLVGVLGAAAFVFSMAFDWVSMSLPANFGQDGAPLQGRTFGQSVVNSAALGQVYALAGIAMLACVGSVITRPELALRMRLGVAGLGLGMLSIVLAATMTLQRRTLEQWGYPVFYGGPDVSDITTALEAGLFAAYAAAVLPVVAVWIAARPAARAARQATTQAAESELAAEVTPAPRDAAELVDLPAPPPSGRAGSVGGITVTASEPLDLSVTPDAWRT
jgi:hypothetical protein